MKTESYTLSTAKADLNPLTGDWLVSGHGRPYVCSTWKEASQMLQTVDHYNRTKKQKRFRPISKKLLQSS